MRLCLDTGEFGKGGPDVHCGGQLVCCGAHFDRAWPPIGVRTRVSVRAVRLSFDEGFPEAGLYRQVPGRV